MQSTPPLVSIITPVYNGAAYLDDLMVSVRDQDYPLIEHIIIDDGSNDDGATVAVLKKYPHLRWWSRENRGQYATMNEGLEAAKGDIVCFVSADDFIAAGAVTKIIRYLLDHADADGVYGEYECINAQGAPINLMRPLRKMPLKFYPYCLQISHSSLYLRRATLLEKQLFFDPALQYVGDYDWMVRLLRAPLNIRYVPSILSHIRVHEGQTTNLSFFAMRDETFKVQKRLKVSAFWASFFRKILFIAKVVNVACEAGINQALKLFLKRLASKN